MNRRNAIVSLGGTAAAVAGLALSAPAAFGQPAHEGHKPGAAGDHWDHCIVSCTACVVACGKAREHCANLAKGGKGEHAPIAALTADCGDCCALCLALVSRKSQVTAAVAEGCAKCCDKCARGSVGPRTSRKAPVQSRTGMRRGRCLMAGTQALGGLGKPPRAFVAGHRVQLIHWSDDAVPP